MWCPFDTEQSNFVKLLKQNEFNVVFTHVEFGCDFFNTDVPVGHIDYIISNPPYSMKTEVFKRLFELGIPFGMLVGVVGLFESQDRFNKRISYFRDYSSQIPDLNPPFSSVYITMNILPERIVFETIEKKELKQISLL